MTHLGTLKASREGVGERGGPGAQRRWRGPGRVHAEDACCTPIQGTPKAVQKPGKQRRTDERGNGAEKSEKKKARGAPQALQQQPTVVVSDSDRRRNARTERERAATGEDVSSAARPSAPVAVEGALRSGPVLPASVRRGAR